jgi:CubicO group peptidase (beta-lactamase class C family)
MVVVLAGCGADKAESADPTAPVAGQSSQASPRLVSALPLPENAVKNAVTKLDDIAEDLMAKSGIPGMAVAVVHGEDTVYAKGFGVKNIQVSDEPGNRVDPDTVFQLASLSKPLDATGWCRRDQLGHPDRRGVALVCVIGSWRDEDGHSR